MEIVIHTDVLRTQIKELEKIKITHDKDSNQVGDGSSIRAISQIGQDSQMLENLFETLLTKATAFFRKALNDYEKADKANADAIENSLNRSPVPAPKQSK
ncbi:hypothetical protein OZX72_08155 [Bifidobacterium sp. ESL0769]|uniref:hypothetical protein n=1 Tax=Bifidobacterium sp. ESL0769 TaxID=2983229 RepID=UPI0023F62529|nr:hypothetical protein [Bifidobacterium sp. ESL0769]WEV67198.1 hypothetical protein OZX72_08155 [Bifidobacterium sp. ESL0769]